MSALARDDFYLNGFTCVDADNLILRSIQNKIDLNEYMIHTLPGLIAVQTMLKLH